MQVRPFLTSFCHNSCVHNKLTYFVNSNWYTTPLCLNCKVALSGTVLSLTDLSCGQQRLLTEP